MSIFFAFTLLIFIQIILNSIWKINFENKKSSITKTIMPKQDNLKIGWNNSGQPDQPHSKNFQKAVVICQTFLNDYLIEKVYRNVLQKIRHIKKQALRSYEKLSNNLIECEVSPDCNVKKQFTKEEVQPEITFLQPKLGVKRANIQESQSFVNKTLKKLRQNMQQDIKEIDIYNTCVSFIDNLNQTPSNVSEKNLKNRRRANVKIAKKGMLPLQQYYFLKSTVKGEQNSSASTNDEKKLQQIENQLREQKIKQALELQQARKKHRRWHLSNQSGVTDQASKNASGFSTKNQPKCSILPQTNQNQKEQGKIDNISQFSMNSSELISTFTFDDVDGLGKKDMVVDEKKDNQNLKKQTLSSLKCVKEKVQSKQVQQRFQKTGDNFRRLNSFSRSCQRKFTKSSHLHRISMLKQADSNFFAGKTQNFERSNKGKNTLFMQKCSRIKQSFQSELQYKKQAQADDINSKTVNSTNLTDKFVSTYQKDQIRYSNLFNQTKGSQQHQTIKSWQEQNKGQSFRVKSPILKNRFSNISVVNPILFQQIFTPKEKVSVKNQSISSHEHRDQYRLSLMKSSCCNRNFKENIGQFSQNLSNILLNQSQHQKMALTFLPKSLMERKKLYRKFQRSQYRNSTHSLNRTVKPPFLV